MKIHNLTRLDITDVYNGEVIDPSLQLAKFYAL